MSSNKKAPTDTATDRGYAFSSIITIPLVRLTHQEITTWLIHTLFVSSVFLSVMESDYYFIISMSSGEVKGAR